MAANHREFVRMRHAIAALLLGMVEGFVRQVNQVLRGSVSGARVAAPTLTVRARCSQITPAMA